MMYRAVSHRPSTASLRREVRLRRYRQLLLLSAKLTDPTDPLTKYTEQHFQEMYRLSKESFRELLSIIQGDLDRLDNRGRPLPAPYQLLLALHFYCTGSYQKEVGEQHGLEVSQPTVCRTIHRVSEALARRYGQFVVFPSTTQAPEIHERFYEVAQFPNVIGAIDCIHMRISNPGGTMAEQCRNSKGWYSINCQVVVGPNLCILTAIVRWGGSVPDWLIYDNSRLRRVLEQERSYNRAHSSTRRRARQAFGMIRHRFQCTARELRSNPKTSCAVILSCFALHNFVLQRQGPQEDAEAFYAPDDVPQDRFSGECDPEGESYRQHIIHEWFSSDAPEEVYQEERLGESRE
ncbi:hypothetical protein O3P69_014519 [Scylla paramamosain]|uniref:Putative nuclease HARBI1 n=1 Tax=Scylla paramamosain TaxID=85552 RepID=A0AAW0TEL2_SCYPA